MAGTSAIKVQQEIILETVHNTAHGEWKVLVLDEGSKRLVDGAVREDDILEENVTNIEQIEKRRPMNQEMDAVYLLSPLSHIVDCLMADLERRRYRKFYVIWTSVLKPEIHVRLERSSMAREHIVQERALNVDFYPRESHLITFRDPWSFPTLFHPACNHLVREHMDDLAQKIVSICVSLGEYPTIRYFNPRNPTHEAHVLCSHLARFVQVELDKYAKYHQDFPPPSPRPRGALIIADRSLDLFAPLVHEFTYQAMIHDLLPIIEGDKIYYKTLLNQNESNEETKDLEISERDSIWVKYRHLHMKDLLQELVNDFNNFKAKNSQFAESDKPTTINNVKDMLAGLPQYQQGKEAYSLHLGMVQEAMKIFQDRRLADIASVEQSLATGLDEDYKRPKNLADQVVRLLDEDEVSFPDRLRLIIEYLLYRDGLLPSDIQKLLLHARLPMRDGEVVHNLDLLGAHVTRNLKDTRPAAQPLLGKKQPPPAAEEESGLSRFEPILKTVLEEHVRGTLDQSNFPFTKPHLDAAEGLMGQDNVSHTSLRSAKPTWARTRPSTVEPKQRIIVFMAGGATYSESRACYEVSNIANKDVFLATSHMLTPSLYLRQIGDLSVDKRQLGLPAERPKPRAPDHLFEREPPPKPQPPPAQAQRQQPPLAGMAAMNLGSSQASANGSANGTIRPTAPQPQTALPSSNGKLGKQDKDKDMEKKKKHHFFSSKK